MVEEVDPAVGEELDPAVVEELDPAMGPELLRRRGKFSVYVARDPLSGAFGFGALLELAMKTVKLSGCTPFKYEPTFYEGPPGASTESSTLNRLSLSAAVAPSQPPKSSSSVIMASPSASLASRGS